MQLEAAMKVTHINTRREREGDSDDGPLAVDVKLEANLDIDRLKKCFSSDASFRLLLSNLFDENDDLLTLDIAEIPLKVEAEKCAASLTTQVSEQSVSFEEAKFNSIRITPTQGRVANVTARLQTRVTDEQYAMLGSMLKHDVDFKLSGAGATPEAAKDQGELSLARGKTEGAGEATEGTEKMLPVPDLSAAAEDDKPKVEVPGQKPPQRPRKGKSSGASATH